MSTLLASGQAVSSPGWPPVPVWGWLGTDWLRELGLRSLLPRWRVEGSTPLVNCWLILAATEQVGC